MQLKSGVVTSGWISKTEMIYENSCIVVNWPKTKITEIIRVSHFVDYWNPGSLLPPPMRIVLQPVAAMLGVKSGDLKRPPSYERKYPINQIQQARLERLSHHYILVRNNWNLQERYSPILTAPLKRGYTKNNTLPESRSATHDGHDWHSVAK